MRHTAFLQMPIAALLALVLQTAVAQNAPPPDDAVMDAEPDAATLPDPMGADADADADSEATDPAGSGDATLDVVADDPSVLASETVRLADRAVLLDSVRVGEEIIAVGERGIIVRGAGDAFRQVADVPTRSTLTAAYAVGEQVWAVGHDGVIVHSTDGGARWERQRADPWRADSDDLQNGVPLLDVLFLDGTHGFAIGAYSLMLETRDGGKSWRRRSIRAPEAPPAADESADAMEPADAPADEGSDDGNDNDSWNFSADELDLEAETDPHLNAITRTESGGLLIAAERGTAFHSRDGGATWKRLKLPYPGSMFGALGFANEHALLFGLRGNVMETFDLGDTWHEVDSGVEASLLGGMALPGGGAMLVGANGVVLRRGTGEDAFVVSRYRTATGESPILSGVVTGGKDDIVVLGERGIAPYRQ